MSRGCRGMMEVVVVVAVGMLLQVHVMVLGDQ